MWPHLALACLLAFFLRLVLKKIRTRSRLAQYARAKHALKDARIWVGMDYTAEERDTKEAKRLLDFALFQAKCEELNYRVMLGGTVARHPATMLIWKDLQRGSIPVSATKIGLKQAQASS